MALRSFFFTAILICEAADSAKFDSKHKKSTGWEQCIPPCITIHGGDFSTRFSCRKSRFFAFQPFSVFRKVFFENRRPPIFVAVIKRMYGVAHVFTVKYRIHHVHAHRCVKIHIYYTYTPLILQLIKRRYHPDVIVVVIRRAGVECDITAPRFLHILLKKYIKINYFYVCT